MQIGQFQATLYADDTDLSLSDFSLISLKNRVNMELITMDHWLRRNRLSLNYAKSNHNLNRESNPIRIYF